MVPAGGGAAPQGDPRAPPHGGTSFRSQPNVGRVLSIGADGVMALVEIEAGPYLLTAAVTRDCIEDSGFARGTR